MTPTVLEPHAAGVLFRGWRPGLLDDAPGDLTPEETTRIRLLDYLWSDERGQATSEGLLVATAAVYELENWERGALGLPEPDESIQVGVGSDSYPGQASFTLMAVLRERDTGRPLLPDQRLGPWILAGGRSRLVSKAASDLLEAIDAKPAPQRDEQLLWVGRVRAAAKAASADLDEFLDTQDIVVPKGLTLRIRAQAPDRLEVDPFPEGLEPAEEEQLAEKFADQRGPVASSFSARVDGRSIRMVLNKDARDTSMEVRQHRVISGRDVPRFIANPEAFVPDGIDLSRFSPRVRGLLPQRYLSRPYVRLEETDRRDWFAVSPDIELVPDVSPTSFGHDDDGDNAAGDLASHEGSSVPEVDADHYRVLCEESVETGERFFLTNAGWIEIDPEEAAKYLDLMERAEPSDDGRLLLSREQVGMVLDVISNVEDLEFASGPRELERELLPELPDYPLPSSLEATLFPHQVVGYRWLRYLGAERLGGLLADDMGLGKTVQLIALLSHLADEGTLRPALVVAPLTLLENWARELRRFCPEIHRIYLHRGPERPRDPGAFGRFDVVLCTYETLRRDQLVLGEVEWSVIACDEAQYVKNPTAQVTSAAKGMKARHRVALTGTPVENGLSELWCIVDFVQPGRLLSRKEFRTEFERPISEAVGDPEKRRDLVYRLQQRLTPHFLRRTKEEILSALPPKTYDRFDVPLGERQKQIYGRVVAGVRSGKINALEGLTKLIVLCSHPEAVEPTDASPSALVASSPKLEKTLDILGEIRERGEKAVVFSRFRRVQDILQAAILDRYQLHAPILNGDSQAEHRLGLVDRFSSRPGFGVMILSPQAAGVGLNITAATHVIHYTRLWNPARENQATDRVHRIGQERPVTIHYPIVAGDDFLTVEQHLDDLLRSKEDLARDVLWSREALDLDKELQARVFGEQEETG